MGYEHKTKRGPADAEHLFSTPSKGSGTKFWKLDGLPRTPSHHEMKRAIIPHPPRLNPDDSPDKHFIKIVSSFYKIHIFRYGKNVEISRHIGYPRGSKHYKLIVEFAKYLIKYKLAPACWIMFSFRVWDEYITTQKEKTKNRKRKKKYIPNVAWVFSLQRINEQHGWCSRLSYDYRGGTVVYCPAHRELMSRLQKMRHALTKLSPESDEANAREIVDKYFPDNSYAKLLRLGNEQAVETQQSLQELADNGDWLWQGTRWNVKRDSNG